MKTRLKDKAKRRFMEDAKRRSLSSADRFAWQRLRPEAFVKELRKLEMVDTLPLPTSSSKHTPKGRSEHHLVLIGVHVKLAQQVLLLRMLKWNKKSTKVVVLVTSTDLITVFLQRKATGSDPEADLRLTVKFHMV